MLACISEVTEQGPEVISCVSTAMFNSSAFNQSLLMELPQPLKMNPLQICAVCILLSLYHSVVYVSQSPGFYQKLASKSVQINPYNWD